MLEFIDHGVVEGCDSFVSLGFNSNVFPTIKKDGTARVILSLKELNEHIPHIRFKMYTFSEVVQLIQLLFYYL